MALKHKQCEEKIPSKAKDVADASDLTPDISSTRRKLKKPLHFRFDDGDDTPISSLLHKLPTSSTSKTLIMYKAKVIFYDSGRATLTLFDQAAEELFNESSDDISRLQNEEMIFAAADTSFMVLEWGMTELVRNTNAMNKLKEEMREIANGELRVREEDLIKACYLKAVIKEVLRLHPSGPLLIPKEAMENCKVQDYEVPMKAKVIINAWSIGRDPKYWEAPDEFRPERFLNSPVDFRGHDFQFIPFGSGRRICPGINFALPTLELAFANLINQFDWTLPDGMKVEDLNMEEAPGITVGRKERLILIAKKVMKQ